MQDNLKSIFRILVLSNALTSIIITCIILSKFLYNIELLNLGLLIILSYGILWFYSLYKLFNFSKVGFKIYVTLVIVGFIFNILSNFDEFNKIFYVLTLIEHLIIGSIITFVLFSQIKSKFK